jgi:hypothetical protein
LGLSLGFDGASAKSVPSPGLIMGLDKLITKSNNYEREPQSQISVDYMCKWVYRIQNPSPSSQQPRRR